MWGCPPLASDPPAVTLTSAPPVDYCPSAGPVAGAFDRCLLLNGVGVVVGGVVLLTFRWLGQLHRALTG
jgi:hypothetical protein